MLNLKARLGVILFFIIFLSLCLGVISTKSTFFKSTQKNKKKIKRKRIKKKFKIKTA
jgi:Na+-transporting NADH:ubiquinone oxidoreductase subunit NqrC